MKIKVDSYDNLSLNKMIKLHNMTIVIRSVFQGDNKYYPHVFLDKCLYKLKMLEHNRIDISEEIDVNKTNAWKECDICHYWYFKKIDFRYEPYLCNCYHGLMQKAISFNDVAIVPVKGSDYRTHFWYMSKGDAKNIMKNLVWMIEVVYYNSFLLYIKMDETAYYQRNWEKVLNRAKDYYENNKDY